MVDQLLAPLQGRFLFLAQKPSMNYLAHLFLSPPSAQMLLGSLIADFTRGRLDTLAREYPRPVLRGIALHRRIDRFTDQHPVVQQSKQRFSPTYRRYAGILVDILHDHFLSHYWNEYTGRDRIRFIRDVYLLLEQCQAQLPPRLRRLAPRICREDWLGSYHDLEVIGFVYERMAQRLGRPDCLAGAIDEVKASYRPLADDFNRFFPELIRFVGQQEDLKHDDTAASGGDFTGARSERPGV